MTPHQDGTFLYNEPLKLFGFWFPIDDATEENGCLWYVPGSHSEPVTRRFLRTGQVGKITCRSPVLVFVFCYQGGDRETPRV